MKSSFLALGLFFGFTLHARTPAYLGVVNKGSNTASFINLESGVAAFTVATGYLPHEVAALPDGTQAFISNYGKDHVRSTSPTNRPGNTLTVVDLKTGLSMGEIDMGEPAPCAPHGMVPSRDGRRLYVTCEAREQIAVVDVATRRVTHSIPTRQPQSHMMVINADETRAYTANFAAGSVTVLDLKTGEPIRHIATGAGNEGVALSPDGKYIYASAVLENKVFKIDATTFEVVATAETERSPVRVLATADGTQVITVNSAGRSVQIFSPENLSLVKTLPVGKQPIGVALSDDGQLYVANMLDHMVSVVDLQSVTVVRQIQTGLKPDGITYIPARGL